jgi:hypothetical protein
LIKIGVSINEKIDNNYCNPLQMRKFLLPISSVHVPDIVLVHHHMPVYRGNPTAERIVDQVVVGSTPIAHPKI